MTAEFLEAASRLISSHLVWDNHGCLPLKWDDDRFLPQLARYRDSGVEAVVRHIDYAVQRIGADHVGIGLDYVFDMQELVDFTHEMHRKYPDNPDYDEPMRFVAPEQLSEIVAALMGLGYRDEDLAKILGGNHLRIAQEVWRKA